MSGRLEICLECVERQTFYLGKPLSLVPRASITDDKRTSSVPDLLWAMLLLWQDVLWICVKKIQVRPMTAGRLLYIPVLSNRHKLYSREGNFRARLKCYRRPSVHLFKTFCHRETRMPIEGLLAIVGPDSALMANGVFRRCYHCITAIGQYCCTHS